MAKILKRHDQEKSMKKLFFIIALFFVFISVSAFADEKNLNDENLTVFLDKGFNFLVPEKGFFIPLQYMSIITRLPANFIDMTLDNHINKLQKQLNQTRFWSDFWFITSCVSGAIVLGAAIYIVLDWAINHRAMILPLSCRF